ncbi:hypothetical protein B3286c1_1164 [Brucella vulpis]|nr:hypothetical protein BF3285c1_1165 [Brucella vulpis]CUW49986.1 hypothetical protein B3286c1_1164 [Brucella vulpis]
MARLFGFPRNSCGSDAVPAFAFRHFEAENCFALLLEML